MSTDSTPEWTVLSVGNPARGDDGFGPLVRARLARQPELRDLAAFEDCSHTILGILEVWKGRANVVTIGTAWGGTERPGHVYRLEYSQQETKRADDGIADAILRGHGTLGLALELGAALGVVPRRLIVYAVHGQNFNLGARLSRPVGAAVAPLAAGIRRDILATGRRTIDDAEISEVEPYDTFGAWLHHHEVYPSAAEAEPSRSRWSGRVAGVSFACVGFRL